MARELRNTFTSGEIAKLANISKQALAYYEKEQLIKPAKRNADNNYAYYSLAEHHILEMIVCLRDLGFSIKNIKEFLDYRNENIVDAILTEKEKELVQQKLELEEKIHRVQTILKKTKHIKNIMLDRVALEQQPKYEMFVSEQLSAIDGDRANLVIRLNFMKNLFKFNNCDLTSGWFLSKEATENLQLSPVSRFFAMDNDNAIDEFKNLINHETPSQFYVSIYGKGNYHSCCKEWLGKCLEFIKHNNLKINGDTIVSFAKDYWLTNDKNEYIFKISIPVE